MKYQGGKHQIGTTISKIINSKVNTDMVDGYFEPFCGSLGVYKNMIKYNYKKYIANDLQPDLIMMWDKLQKDKLVLPDNFSEELWRELKTSPSPNELKAVAGYGMSYGGQYFSGYIQKHSSNSGRDFYKEFKNSILKIKKELQKGEIEFNNKNYYDFKPNNMLIYCDPPYKNTTGYKVGKFNSDLFWNTMREWSKNNYVFISEEEAPDDFEVVWEQKKRRTLNSKVRECKIEKLYFFKE
jgi:DNA adenine methylase